MRTGSSVLAVGLVLSGIVGVSGFAGVAGAEPPAAAASAASGTTGGDTPAPEGAASSEASATAPVAAPSPESTPDAPPPPKPGGRASWHPEYVVDLEAHGLISAFETYDVGLGFGAHATVIVADRPMKGVDNDLGVGIGADVVRYGAYKPKNASVGEGKVLTWSLYVPLYLQWNFWLGSRAAFFLEPQIWYRFSKYDNGCPTGKCEPSTRVMPAGAIGLRFRITDHVAGVVRAGWPMAQLGVSWL